MSQREARGDATATHVVRFWVVLAAIVVFLAMLVLVAVLVRLLEPQLAFFPTQGETNTPRDFGVEYDTLMVTTSDGQRLRAWQLHGHEHRARVLYFHGNGGNLSVWAPILVGIAARGYDVFAFDYRGYGLSTGRPTEKGVYGDVSAVATRFWNDSPTSEPVVYWGRSLGVAMAAYAATLRQPDALILESGFPNARSLVRMSPVLSALGLFSTYRFPSDQFLTRIGTPVPVLVLHGDNDHVIPFAQGQALFESVPGSHKQFITIRGGDHNDVVPSDRTRYWNAVQAFIEGLERGR
jgi:uncharacterized protein